MNSHGPSHKSLDSITERARLSRLRAEERRAAERVRAIKRHRRRQLILAVILVIIIVGVAVVLAT